MPVCCIVILTGPELMFGCHGCWSLYKSDIHSIFMPDPPPPLRGDMNRHCEEAGCPFQTLKGKVADCYKGQVS